MPQFKQGIWKRSQVRERKPKARILEDIDVQSGGRMWTPKRTQEKKNLGREEKQQSEMPQKPR